MTTTIEQSPEQTEAEQILPEQLRDRSELPETKGEKMFHIFRFFVAEVFIIGVTALLAYAASHKPTFFGGRVKNPLHTFTHWLRNDVLERSWIPSRVADAFAMTMVTFHGGNLFTPIMHKIDHSKEGIVTFFNKHFGSEEEVEIGRERVSQEKKPTFWDEVKSRCVSFSIVFTAFMSADLLMGTKKVEVPELNDTRDVYRLDIMLDKGGRLFSHWTDKTIKPFFSKQRLANFGPENVVAGLGESDLRTLGATYDLGKSYRFGKMLSMDVFATTMAISIWTTASRIFANRHKEEGGHSLFGSLVEKVKGLFGRDKEQSVAEAQPGAADANAHLPQEPVAPSAHLDIEVTADKSFRETVGADTRAAVERLDAGKDKIRDRVDGFVDNVRQRTDTATGLAVTGM